MSDEKDDPEMPGGAPSPSERRLSGSKRSLEEAGLPDAASAGASPNKRARRAAPHPPPAPELREPHGKREQLVVRIAELRALLPRATGDDREQLLKNIEQHEAELSRIEGSGPTNLGQQRRRPKRQAHPASDWKTNPATRIAMIEKFRPTCDRLPCFRDDPRYVTHIASSIVAHLRETEHLSMVPREWEESLAGAPGDPHIDARVRCIMIDWLHKVFVKFKLKREVFYLAVQLLDRFCAEAAAEGEPVTRKNYQLTGCTCLWIASKYHEIYAPEMRDFVQMAGNAFTRLELSQQERRVLGALNFELTLPTVDLFLQRFLFIARPLLTGTRRERAEHVAAYLAEHSIHTPDYLKHAPSLVAATAVYLGMVMTQSGQWCEELEKCSGYTVEDIKEGPVQAMREAFTNPEGSYARLLTSVNEKYGSEEHGKVSSLEARRAA